MTALPSAAITQPKRGRLAYLDGLRGVSIVLVILSHLGLRPHGSENVSWCLRYLGQTGVDIFFVLSGYLITTLLIREQELASSVNLGSFYLRRALRILPAYATFLLLLGLFARVHWVSVSGRSWILALTYTSSLVMVRDWSLAHTWSLAVEEQFYLLWPLCLCGLNRRTAGIVAVLVILCSLAVREGAMALPTRLQPNLAYWTLARIDAIMAGCLLALCLSSRTLIETIRRLPVGTCILWAGIVLLLASAWMGRLAAWHSPAYTARALGITNILCWLLVSEQCWLTRVLSIPPLVALGRLSYSLYLWQQPFLNHSSHTWPCRFPQNLFLALAFAYMSWIGVEAPFLRLKDSLTKRHGREKAASTVTGIVVKA